MVLHIDQAPLQEIKEIKGQNPPPKQPTIKEKASELKNKIENIITPKKNNNN
jgi:hypothetical protein